MDKSLSEKNVTKTSAFESLPFYESEIWIIGKELERRLTVAKIVCLRRSTRRYQLQHIPNLIHNLPSNLSDLWIKVADRLNDHTEGKPMMV